MFFWNGKATHRVSRLYEAPIVLVQMKTPYRYDIGTHQMFEDIDRLVDMFVDDCFIVYDFRDFSANHYHFDGWMRAQCRGVRGSITDDRAQTIFVGTCEQLQPIADAFRWRFGMPIGVCSTVDEAVSYVNSARRVLAAW